MNSLREALADYLVLRRSLGFKLHDTALGLKHFVLFLEQKGSEFITSNLALEWAILPAHAQPSHWSRRLTWVRGFAKYRSAFDPRTETPLQSLLPFRTKRVVPYLYSDEEIQALMKASLTISALNGFRGRIFYTLFGLLAVSGLRISEALNLKIGNIDFEEGFLVIRKTKFGKSRLVPLHASTLQALSKYLTHRKQYLKSRTSEFLFISSTGNRLDAAEVKRKFYSLSRQTGLREPGSSSGPRLHDFRHRFAVKTLLRWYQNGEDAQSRLPVLSTYLGHAHVSDTYWYLTAFPELMGEAMERLESRWEVMP